MERRICLGWTLAVQVPPTPAESTSLGMRQRPELPGSVGTVWPWLGGLSRSAGWFFPSKPPTFLDRLFPSPCRPELGCGMAWK